MNRRSFLLWLPVALLASFFSWLGLRALRIQSRKPIPGPASYVGGSEVKVAGLGELSELWSFRYFEYAGAPAVALNTPTPVAGGISSQSNLIAFSRVCTHQGCHVHLITDPEAGALLYNYRSETPFLGCPCHFGAYDPLQAGRPVFGPPQLPLPRIRLELRGEEVWATGKES